jgi:hypothetical protein
MSTAIRMKTNRTMSVNMSNSDPAAALLTTEDSDLRSLGETYQSVRVVNWDKLKAALAERGLIDR